MNYEDFKIYLKQVNFLNDKDKDKLLEMVQIIDYPSNKIVLHKGEKSEQVGIISKGLIRAYDKNNKTVWLFLEDKVYGSMEFLTTKCPSSLTYETIEETTLFLFNYNELESLIHEHPNIAILLLMYWKNTAMDIYCTLYSSLHSTPEKRYLQLLHQNSKLTLRVKSKDLATYLGIHPVSLSRLKKRYFNPK